MRNEEVAAGVLHQVEGLGKVHGVLAIVDLSSGEIAVSNVMKRRGSAAIIQERVISSEAARTPPFEGNKGHRIRTRS